MKRTSVKHLTEADKDMIQCIVQLLQRILQIDATISITYDPEYFITIDPMHRTVQQLMSDAASVIRNKGFMYLNEQYLADNSKSETLRTVIHELLHVKYQQYSEYKIQQLERKYMP